MRFQITEAEAREMARLEEESGCDISAGLDWGIHLDKVMELALCPDNHKNDLAIPLDLTIIDRNSLAQT